MSHQLTITNKLPYTVLETVVLEVVWLINTKPIAVKYTAEDDVVAICPNDILLGRSHRLRPDLAALPQLSKDQDVIRALEHRESLVTEWMKQWLAQAFPEMVARTTWKQ